MPPRSFLKPVATVLTSAVLVTGFAPTALAANEADQVRIVSIAQPTLTVEQNEAKAKLASASIEDIDWVEAFKVAFKVLQPFAVAGLRYGGPIASAVIEYVGDAVSRFPQLGQPLNDLFFKPTAALVREWAPRLADLLESIKIDNVPRDEATTQVATHLHKVEKLSDKAASVLAKGLVANL